MVFRISFVHTAIFLLSAPLALVFTKLDIQKNITNESRGSDAVSTCARRRILNTNPGYAFIYKIMSTGKSVLIQMKVRLFFIVYGGYLRGNTKNMLWNDKRRFIPIIHLCWFYRFVSWQIKYWFFIRKWHHPEWWPIW